MQKVEHLQVFDQIKRRLTILQILNELKKAGIPPAAIIVDKRVVKSYSKDTSQIESGEADTALGLQSAAGQYGLDYVPLFEERYHLIPPREQKKVLTCCRIIYKQSIFRATESLTGYSAVRSGQQIPP